MTQRPSSEATTTMTGNPLPVFTIGHSTRTIADFVTLLRAGEVQLVVDIRRMPRSQTNPQYNIDALPGALAPGRGGRGRGAGRGGGRGGRGGPPEAGGGW